MAQKIAIIGTGLIGGSLGLAIKLAKLDVEIVGHDKDSSVAALAKKRGALDKSEWNLHAAVDGAGLVILAIPVMGIRETLATIAGTLGSGAIVTDTASTKQEVIKWAEEILPPGVSFVGGHPLTSTLGSGIEAASATLFTNKAYCLMPARTATQQSLETMINLANLVGARPYFLDPLEHDAFAAAVDHLPFLAAAALVGTVTASNSWAEIRRLASTEFENASLPMMAAPAIYAGIVATNKEPILRWLDEYAGRLAELRAMVEREDAGLAAIFGAAQVERAKWMATRDQDFSDLPEPPRVDGTGTQIRQLFMGNLGNRPLPGEKKGK